MNSSHTRLAGWSGIAFVILSAVFPVLAPLWPPAGASAAELHAYFSQHHAPFLVGNYLAVVASLPSFLQLGALAVLFHARVGLTWKWVSAIIASSVAHAVGALVLAGFQATAFLARGEVSEAAHAAAELSNVGFGFFLVVLSGASFCLALAFVESKLVPAWLAWLGVPTAVLVLAASLGAIWPVGVFAAGGLVTVAAFSLFCGWTMLTSVAILRS